MIKIISYIFFLLIMSAGYVTKAAREHKNEKALQTVIDSLMSEKKFEFVGRTALPLGYPSVDLAGNLNGITFQPGMVESQMPFYGRAFGGVAYTNNTGFRFKGKPIVYTVEKTDDGYDVYAEVKDNAETYRISLAVGADGFASMTIQSINRSTIRYNGVVSAINREES